MSRVRTWELTCPGLLEEVSRARRWTRDILGDDPRADDAALIVTELSTNALLHSASGTDEHSFTLTVTRTPHRTTLTIRDSGGTRTKPHIKHTAQTTPNGRGLPLVAALADHLEAHGDTHGHVVTATLPATSPTTPGAPAS